MIKKSWYLPAFISTFLCIAAHAQFEERDSLIIRDDFSDLEQGIDLSTLLLWGGHQQARSGFRTGTYSDEGGQAHSSISISADAIAAAGYRPGTIQASLAVDYPLPTPIYRGTSTFIVEFDAIWESLNNQGWGESGRLVVFLLHQYPRHPIEFNAAYDVDQPAPFGRPAYNIRIRNHNRTGQYHSGGFMLYGGGHDVNGEFEQYNGDYWLPGFSSEAGGGTPGLGRPYPLSPTAKNESLALASTTAWMHYTWIIRPERLELYVRKSAESPDEDQLALLMEIPSTEKTPAKQLSQINEAHSTQLTQLPPLYHWFDSLAAVRIYFRGAQQTHLANLRVTHRYLAPVITHVFDANEQIRVCPNPAHGRFQIMAPASNAGMPWQITDLLGTVVRSGRIPAGSSGQQVRMDRSAPGVYLLSTGAKPVQVVKVILR